MDEDNIKGVVLKTNTKKELAQKIVDIIGCRNNIAQQIVDSLFKEMAEQLMQGNRIEIRGLGVWEVRNQKPRPDARNPRTGETVNVPARRKVHFKPGMKLKEGLRQPRC